MIKKWAAPDMSAQAINTFAQQTGLPEFLCAVMAGRGYDSAEKITDILEETNLKLQPPFIFKDMDRVVWRIEEAIMLDQRICIYGDYDCDGVTATAILLSYFRSINVDAFYYIPNRFTEGYGMNRDAIKRIKEKGADLIITVDNGISAHKEITFAKSNGIDVVVTDHHTPQEVLPDCPVVDPHRSDCPSVFKDIAGVGVAFYLVCALQERDPLEVLPEYSDILAIGTVADVVTLTHDNRQFVKHGLKSMAAATRPGIAALMDVAGVTKAPSSRSLAFGIAPHINAAGRIEDATPVVELLLIPDQESATKEASKLSVLNSQRKDIEAEILQTIERELEEAPGFINKRVLVVAGEGWHQGVIGIVAARLVDKYGKPSIVFSINGVEAHGSGRSICEVSLIEAVSACRDLLIGYGGHRQAAGLTIATKNIEEFSNIIDAFCAQRYPIMPVKTLALDSVVEPYQITLENTRYLEKLEPFGEGNPSPVFGIYGAAIVKVKPTTSGEHVRLHLKKGPVYFQAMYFRMTPEQFPFREMDLIDLAVQIDIGEYKGEPQLTICVQEAKPAGFEYHEISVEYERYLRHLRGEYDDMCKKSDLLPDRAFIATVYKVLKSRLRTATTIERLYTGYKKNVPFDMLCVTLDILDELALVKKVGNGYMLAGRQERIDLSKSLIMMNLSK